MEKFIPGKVVHEFDSAKGNHVIIRFPRWGDLDEYTRFVNKLSQEDTFILFAGEEISKENEASYFGSLLQEMEFSNAVALGAWIGDTLIGVTGMERSTKTRLKHIGNFGIMVDSDYRQEKIGEALMRTILEVSPLYMEGLRLVRLHAFAMNVIARNLYRKLGFVECGSLPEEYFYKGEYVDGVVMTKSLIQ